MNFQAIIEKYQPSVFSKRNLEERKHSTIQCEQYYARVKRAQYTSPQVVIVFEFKTCKEAITRTVTMDSRPGNMSSSIGSDDCADERISLHFQMDFYPHQEVDIFMKEPTYTAGCCLILDSDQDDPVITELITATLGTKKLTEETCQSLVSQECLIEIVNETVVHVFPVPQETKNP